MPHYIDNSTVEKKIRYGADSATTGVSTSVTLDGSTSFYILNITGSDQNVTLPIDGNSEKGQHLVLSVIETSPFNASVQSTNTTLDNVTTLAPGRTITFLYNGTIWLYTSTSINVAQGGSLFALFVSTANSVNNSFLATENIASSDNLPSVAPVTGTITNFTFSGSNTTPSGQFEFRINTVSLAVPADLTVILDGTQTQQTDISLPIIQGDEINCYITNASGVGKPLVKLFI